MLTFTRSFSKRVLRFAIRDPRGLVTFFVYLALSFGFFGRSLYGHFSTSFIGQSCDPSAYMWCLVWWPYAIGRRVCPFATHLVWAPGGVNLARTTCIPLAALVAFPITYAFGPIAAYNLLCLVSPALAGWAAFLLCRYVTRQHWPSLAGGYIFGFSSYVVSQMNAHLVLLLVFPVPLAAYLVVRRIRSDISLTAFVVLMSLVLVIQALLAIEICATMTVFGGAAMLIAIIVSDKDGRRTLYGLVRDAALAYAAAAVVLSPYLYFFFLFRLRQELTASPEMFSADLLNFLVPTVSSLAGGIPAFQDICRRFQGNVAEASAFVNPGLVVIAAMFSRSYQRTRIKNLLLVFLGVVCIASLGSVLHIAGASTIMMPWKLMLELPIIDKALPDRFMMYAFLDFAVITALWLSATPQSPVLRVLIAAAAVVLMLPNLNSDYWVSASKVPALFVNGGYRNYLKRGEVVMPVPQWVNGDSMLWQAETGMYFQLADGYLGQDPAGFARWNRWDNCELLEFLARHHVSAIVVGDWQWVVDHHDGIQSWKRRHDPRAFSSWRLLLADLKATVVQTGGVVIFRLPSATVATLGHLSDQEFQIEVAKNVESRFRALVVNIDQSLSEGLAPYEIEREVTSAPARFATSLYSCSPQPFARIGAQVGIRISVIGSSTTVGLLARAFHNYARRVYIDNFPFDDQRFSLKMDFERAQLRRLARAIAAGAQPIESGKHTQTDPARRAQFVGK